VGSTGSFEPPLLIAVTWFSVFHEPLCQGIARLSLLAGMQQEVM